MTVCFVGLGVCCSRVWGRVEKGFVQAIGFYKVFRRVLTMGAP